MSNFDREQAQRLVDRWNYDDGLRPEWLAQVMALLESALDLHDEHERLTAAHATLREAARDYLAYLHDVDKRLGTDEWKNLKGRIITLACNLVTAEDSRDHPPTPLPTREEIIDEVCAHPRAHLASPSASQPVTPECAVHKKPCEFEWICQDCMEEGAADALSREAKEQALDYASWAGAIGAGVARRVKAGTDTDLEPQVAVTAFHHAIAARRLLDLDPEDA